MGPHDLVRRIAAELGVEEVFWGVAVKPGKPLSFGVRGETLVFGLPGNPVSSLVGALVFVRPALDALQGVADPRPRASRWAGRSRRSAAMLTETSSCEPGDEVDRAGSRARARDRSGVAHDRSCCLGGSARPRSARRRRDRRRRRRALPGPRLASVPVPILRRRPSDASTDESWRRRLRAAGVRRVATERECSQAAQPLSTTRARARTEKSET